jgi:hypothetical protein
MAHSVTIIKPPDAIVGNKFDQMTGHLTKAAARVTASIGGTQPPVVESYNTLGAHLRTNPA